MSKESLFYTKLENGRVCCGLCPHNCEIPDGGKGFCRVRSNRGGVLYSDSYGTVSGIALDPIEKKPLYRFHPGSMIFSVGNYGCNLRCLFCQNHSISMTAPEASAERISPERLAALATQYIKDGNIGIAYTYNEPLIGYEYVYDCAVLAKKQNLFNVLVTNGFINPEPLVKLLPFIDALNIDLKSFDGNFYNNIKGDLKCVMNTIETASVHAHVEITTLVVPDENDSDDEMDALARFVASVNPDIPLHLSRFFPKYKMNGKTPTPKETVFRLQKIAMKYLNYVYLGNMR